MQTSSTAPHLSPGRRLAGPTGPTGLAGLVLAGLVLVGGLSACSSGGGDSATDPYATSTPSEASSETSSETPTETPTGTPGEELPDGAVATLPASGSAGIGEAVLVDATEGGGSPSTLAFALDTEQAVDDFVVDLRAGLPEEVSSAVADLAGQSPDATPYGAVVSTGCEPPRSVVIDAGEAGFEVVPALPKGTVQCLAPVTYVVLFAAPNA